VGLTDLDAMLTTLAGTRDLERRVSFTFEAGSHGEIADLIAGALVAH
jgi:hypothetical protein